MNTLNTILKIVTLLAAAAGVVLFVMKLLEADKRKTEDSKRIAMFKGKISVPTRKSANLRKIADDIADFRDGDDEDAYLFEDTKLGAELSDNDKYADIFDDSDEILDDIADAVNDVADAVEKLEDIIDDVTADDDSDISEDSLTQLLDS